jgi:hypothetical protein
MGSENCTLSHERSCIALSVNQLIGVKSLADYLGRWRLRDATVLLPQWESELCRILGDEVDQAAL